MEISAGEPYDQTTEKIGEKVSINLLKSDDMKVVIITRSTCKTLPQQIDIYHIEN